MSQRGLRPTLGYLITRCFTGRWSHAGSIVALFSALLLTTGVRLTAQNATATPPAGASQVTLRLDGAERVVTTTQTLLRDVLHEEGIALGEHDLCEPSPTSPVTNGMKVVITRVTCAWVTDQVTIPAPKQLRWIRRMTSTPVVIRQGRPGVLERTRVVWKRDGKVSVEWVQRTKVMSQPIPTIFGKGSLPSRGINNSLWMVATAYDPGPKSCGPHSTGHTAIGMHAGYGVIAVDPHVIPLGTRVRVEGYGMAIAADTGSAIRGRHIDVCFPTRWAAKQWGRRLVYVTIIR